MSSDDEIDLTFSSQDRLTKSELTAKKDALKRQLEKKGLKPDFANKVDPTQKLKLSVLKNQFEGQKDAQTKDDKRRQQDKERRQSFGTKSRKEEEEAATLTADTKPTAEQAVKQGESDAKDRDELQKTDVSTEGG